MTRGMIRQAAMAALLSGALGIAVAPSAWAADKPAIVKSAADKAEDSAKPRLSVGTLGSFTPATTHSGGKGAAVEERRFSFTPAGAKNDRREAVTVGVTSRVAGAAPAGEAKVPAAAAVQKAPSEVALDVAVGYRGFALSGGYSRSQASALTPRQGMDVGVSYAEETWKAALQAATSTPDPANFGPPQPGESYSLELGGAYSLKPGLALKGGVRYDLVRPEAFGRDFVNRDAKRAEESGTVYLGTSISF